MEGLEIASLSFHRGAGGIVAAALALLFMFFAEGSVAQQQAEYLLVPGDIIHVTIFKNPEMSGDLRVSEAGSVGFPLVGAVPVSGLSLPAAERKIAQALKDGGFVLNPQVNILLTQALGNQVSVIGQFTRPGRYALDVSGGRLSGMVAAAGGVAETGADVVIVSGMRNGKPFRQEIDVVKMSQSGTTADDIALAGGDTLFANRSSMFYIYGQVQRPGQYRLERGMTVMQALATGGGVTGKGTSRGIVLHRRDAKGKVKEESVALDDDLRDQDVIYVKESLF